MTADNVFQIASLSAMLGWVVLILAVITKNANLRDFWAGLIWPVGLSGLYALLILLFFGKTDGDFDSLANVKLLFQSEWALLAGWIHYLAFDLLIGARNARKLMAGGLSRLWLIPILPLTFLFGPAGYLAAETLLFFKRPISITQ